VRRDAVGAAGRARGAAACAVLSAGAVAVVLAALPFKAFDLDRFFVPKELVLELAAALAALVLLARARRLELARVDVLLAAFLGLSALSAAFAPNWWLAGRALALSLAGAAVFWCARAAARAGWRRALVIAFALAAVVAAATALLQAYGVQSQYVSLNRAPGGTLGNRNFVAHLAAIAMPALLLAALGARRAWGALAGAAGVMLGAGALVLSRSRGAWLALLVAAAVVVLAGAARPRAWREAGLARRARLVLGAALAGIAAAVWLPNHLDWRSESPYLDSMRGLVNVREGSGRGRLIQYRNSLRMALAHPVLGVGPGNWGVRYPRFASRDDPSLDDQDGMTSNPWPSSDWVTFLSERGIPALACLTLVLVGIGVGGLLAVAAATSAAELLPALALLGTLAALVVAGAFDAVLLLPVPAFVGWGLLGALSAPARTRSALELDDGRRRWVLALVAAAGLCAAARGGTRIAAMALYLPDGRLARMEQAARLDPGSYRIAIRLAELAARRGRCADVKRWGGRAIALYPEAPEPRRLLAECGVRTPRR